MRKLSVASALGLLLMWAPSKTVAASKPRLKFVYQQNNYPWEKGSCVHKKLDVPYDWKVVCRLGDTTRLFRVHLAVSYYPRTNYGQSAYEILYWVTAYTATSAPRQLSHNSTTMWIHQDKPDVRATILQLAQGVENDQASLRLTIDFR